MSRFSIIFLRTERCRSLYLRKRPIFLMFSGNRNLDNGTHIIHPHQYAQLETANTKEGKVFIPAHKNFRVIAIAAPVPPYPRYPVDPPFQSHFQACFVDPIGLLLSLTNSSLMAPVPLYDKIHNLILSTQFASESWSALEVISKTSLLPFPQMALTKLRSLVDKFHPPEQLSSAQLAHLFLILHPGLIHAPFQAWAILSRQTTDAGLGELGSPSMSSINEQIGIVGYHVAKIKCVGNTTAEITFNAPPGLEPVILMVPAGPKQLCPFPFIRKLEFNPMNHFMGLLTCFLQAHVVRWDISLILPALPSTTSASMSTLVWVFGQLLGYDAEVIHMYKELGGRELVMWRRIEDGGATTWEPRFVSPILHSNGQTDDLS